MVVLYEEPQAPPTPALLYMVLLMKRHYHFREHQSKTTILLRGPSF